MIYICVLPFNWNEMQKLVCYKLCFIFLLFGCKYDSKKNTTTEKAINKIKYAKGFAIKIENGVKKLSIHSPYQNNNKTFEYIISSEHSSGKNNHIHVPINKIVITSTTHIPMVEMLGEEKSVVGFPYGKYVSSKKTRTLIDEGKIKEIGKESSLNTEILMDLQPDLVVGYSVSYADKSLTTIENSGIPVIYNGDWLEETPLGRAEWIKFFGVLYNKEKEADSIFKKIEKSYLNAKLLASKLEKQPTILSGAIMNKDIWNLPAGDSFVAQFLKDANLNYLWKNTKGSGSLSLSLESIFDKGANADFWIAPGYYASKKQMLQNNEIYKEFKSFKENKIYTPSTKKGATGGIIYYELAPIRPDLVLKDIIKITKPNLLKNYQLTFFEQMK